MLKLTQFSGEIPRLIPRLLPDTSAQRAENVCLDDGGLTPIRRAKLVENLTGAAVTIYKHGEDWLSWDKLVHAAPGPVAQDRLYYTGDGKPKMLVGSDEYDLAVPAPSAAPSGTTSGSGTGDVVDRLYAYTFVTAYGEESEPSPVSNMIEWQSGLTVTLTGIEAPPVGRGITKQRFYRTQTSILTGTDLFLIAERDASNADFTDNIPVDDFAEVLPSRDWNPPPDDLKGLSAGPGGMMAAFVGKDVYFCEPYRPHAWPEKYVLTVDYPVVALGWFGSTLVIMTQGTPYIAAGTHPENMILEKIEQNLPCINARGVVDLGMGVAYPSHDGLVVVDPTGAMIVTRALMERDDWLRLNPQDFIAGFYSGRYFASYAYTEPDGIVVEGNLIIDLNGSPPFIFRGGARATAMHYAVPESALYMVIGEAIYEWDPPGEINDIMTWHSKLFVLPAPTNYGCILIEGSDVLTKEQRAALDAEKQAAEDANAVIFAQASIGGELNGAALNAFALNDDELERVLSPTFTSVTVYADGEAVAVIDTLNEVRRLPGGFKARNWEVAVHGTDAIEQISLARTPRELNAF